MLLSRKYNLYPRPVAEENLDWTEAELHRSADIPGRPFCASHTLDAPLRTHMARS